MEGDQLANRESRPEPAFNTPQMATRWRNLETPQLRTRTSHRKSAHDWS